MFYAGGYEKSRYVLILSIEDLRNSVRIYFVLLLLP